MKAKIDASEIGYDEATLMWLQTIERTLDKIRGVLTWISFLFTVVILLSFLAGCVTVFGI